MGGERKAMVALREGGDGSTKVGRKVISLIQTDADGEEGGLVIVNGKTSG